MNETLDDLPLFPLQTVLFPGGLLQLKVFEARYLDMVGLCLSQGSGFGVVALRRGSEVRAPGHDETEFESVGCLAEILEVDSAVTGILQVRCRGTRRFTVKQRVQAANGLWRAQALAHPADPRALPQAEHEGSARALSRAIQALKQQGTTPFLEPYDFQDAGWIANRWCELLPISVAARQKLMELDDPAVRLQLVDQFLRQKGIVQDD